MTKADELVTKESIANALFVLGIDHGVYISVGTGRHGINGKFLPYNKTMKTLMDIPATQPKWRIVGRDLFPADGQECLITVQVTKDISEVCRATYSTDLYTVDDYDSDGFKGVAGWYDIDGDDGYIKTEDVVAWMPLPEPYKGEGEK